MAKIKKAQLGSLIKKGAKTLAQKVEAQKLSGGLTKAEMKIGKDANKTFKELNINKYNDAPPSPIKLTAEQKANNAKILAGNKKNGGPVKKMKNGGSLSGLKASNKRVGPVDPKGAFTKVQKKTLAGAKGKAKLTKDKQLGATKMAKCGTKMSKK
jgi:hypothetical protein